MKKQTNSFNFILLFFFLPFCSITSGFSQAETQKLSQADSLFGQKKYTESFNIYEQILKQEEKATPRMFLRMAFIKEGLGNYSEALYYLNKYYLTTSDKNAQGKMKEIAEANELQGFNINDRTFFMRQFRSYYNEIIVVVLVLTVLVFLIILYKRFKLNQRPTFPGIVLIAFLTTLFYLINFGNTSNQGIIIENHAYIMSGPSAGSDLIEVVKNGHKVKILDESDLWITIEWNGNKGFIRHDKIKKLG